MLMTMDSFQKKLEELHTKCASWMHDISVPTIHFIHNLKIHLPSNLAFAYRLVSFITYYTQIRRDAFENCRIAYNSIPFATDYAQIHEDALQNLIFAYKVEGVLVKS